MSEEELTVYGPHDVMSVSAVLVHADKAWRCQPKTLYIMVDPQTVERAYETVINGIVLREERIAKFSAQEESRAAQTRWLEHAQQRVEHLERLWLALDEMHEKSVSLRVLAMHYQALTDAWLWRQSGALDGRMFIFWAQPAFGEEQLRFTFEEDMSLRVHHQNDFVLRA
jgi:hypothetical protein